MAEINVTAWPMHYAIAPSGEPHGQLVPFAKAVKDAVTDIRVFAIGAAYGIGAEFGAWPDDPDYAIQRPGDLVALVAFRRRE